MIATTNYDQFRRRVLTHEHLDDVSLFFEPGFFDEIPLYSRYKQIEPFIGNTAAPERVLLGLALDYLKDVTGRAKPRNKFLAAITVLDDKDFDQIVPNVFVCNGQVRQRLHNLCLHDPVTPFGKRMTRVLKLLDPKHEFQLLEDTSTVPGHVRAFIGYRSASGKVTCIGRLSSESAG
jgi:hypothetical protein